jgi:hypothetical protein
MGYLLSFKPIGRTLVSFQQVRAVNGLRVGCRKHTRPFREDIGRKIAATPGAEFFSK